MADGVLATDRGLLSSTIRGIHAAVIKRLEKVFGY
jgi:hypothetical protein